MRVLKQSRTKIQHIEVIIRRTLYFLLMYCVLQYTSSLFYPKLFQFYIGVIPLHIPFLILLCIPITIYGRDFVKQIIQNTELYQEMQNGYFEFTKLAFQRIGIVVFYLFIQCGVVAAFFPKLGEQYINGVPTALIVILVNCIILLCIYHNFIFRKEKQAG